MNTFFIFALSLIIGMILGIILFDKNEYHGPNSNDVKSTIYQNEKTGDCFRFIPEITECSS